MNSYQIQERLEKLQNFLILTRPAYFIRGSDLSGIALAEHSYELSQILDYVLAGTNASKFFRQFIVDRTFRKYRNGNNKSLADIQEPFYIFRFALFDNEKIKRLEKFYIQKETVYSDQHFQSGELDLGINSNDMIHIKFIKDWLNEFAKTWQVYDEYGYPVNDQTLVSLEVCLETIIDRAQQESNPF